MYQDYQKPLLDENDNIKVGHIVDLIQNLRNEAIASLKLASQEQNLIDKSIALSNGKTLSLIANIIEESILKKY